MADRRDFLLSTAAGTLGLWGVNRSLVRADSGSTGNMFLEGNFAPVREESTFDSLEVLGKIPDDLEGMFVRNGPNPQFTPKGHYHWFDGDGMLHGVRLAGGKASYRNRFILTEGLQAERAAGKALWGGLLDPPEYSQVAQGKPLYKNAANTALVWHAGKLLALWEGGEPHEIHLPDLATVGRYDFQKKLRHNFTAHPKVDPQTGEMMFFGYSGFPPYLRYSVAGADGKILRTTAISLPRPVMIHDFAITQNYSIFPDLPEVLSFDGKRHKLSMTFRKDLPARFGVLPRHGQGTAIRWFVAEPCFMFHTLGAYEDGNDIVLIGCRMERMPDEIETGTATAGKITDPAAPGRPMLHRWRFSLSTGSVREERIDDTLAEFPRQRDDLLGYRPRFAYLMRLSWDGLLKYDLDKGTCLRHEHGPGRWGGEGVFVPRSGAAAEDDGWLLTYLYDSRERRSELVIVSAEDFTAPPVARVIIPTRIPFGFHGAWIPADQFAG